MQSATEPVGALVTRRPAAKLVLLRHGIDFCCSGRQRLDEACRAAGVDPAAVVAEIAAAERGGEDAEVRWDIRPLDELMDYILQRFHEPLRSELPALVDAARRVEAVHAGKPRCPAGLADHLEGMLEAVRSHLEKEERALFPLIRAGRGAVAQMPIRVMYEEHEDHGRSLRKLRELTGDLVPPPDACESWRALYEGLERLERDLFEHIHLENNVLFPRALLG